MNADEQRVTAGETAPKEHKMPTASPMARAWSLYHRHAKGRPYSRVLFGNCLEAAWMHYRGDIRRAAWEAKQASMTQEQRRVDAIEAEIGRLPYASFRIDIAARERALRAELAEINTIERAA